METTITKIMKLIKIALTALAAFLLIASMAAVLIYGRTEHLVTVAVYVFIIWIINIKEDKD